MLNKKMLLSLLVIGVVSVSAGVGTWAHFSDTETSTGNTFTAGELDLDGTGSITTVTFDNMIPGDTSAAPQTITLKNLGTMNAAETEFDFDFNTFTDDADREIDVLGAADDSDGAASFAGEIIVDTLMFGTTDLLSSFTGTVTLADVVASGVLTSEGIDFQTETVDNFKDLTIDVHLSADATDICQGDSLTVDIEIALNQVASQTTLAGDIS